MYYFILIKWYSITCFLTFQKERNILILTISVKLKRKIILDQHEKSMRPQEIFKLEKNLNFNNNADQNDNRTSLIKDRQQWGIFAPQNIQTHKKGERKMKKKEDPWETG